MVKKVYIYKNKGKSMFWGLFFIVLGILFLLNYMFGINLPVLRVLFSIFLIYWGFSMLIGSFGARFSVGRVSTESEAVFSSSKFSFPQIDIGHENRKGNEYSTVFGNSEMDLSGLQSIKGKSFKTAIVFGHQKIKIKKGQPVWVQATTVFGNAKLPTEKLESLGETVYRTPGVESKEDALYIKADVVFGDLIIEEIE